MPRINFLSSEGFASLSSSTSKLAKARRKLEEGIEVSQDIDLEIQEVMPDIIVGRSNAKVVSRERNGHYITFSLGSHPKLTFKMIDDCGGSMKSINSLSVHDYSIQYFANAVKAVKICEESGLDLLVIPRMKAFSMDGRIIIAQENLNVISNTSAQEEFYRTLPNLEQGIRQLAIFIIRTGYQEAYPRNLQIVDWQSNFEGNRRIAVVGAFQWMGHIGKGLFGVKRPFYEHSYRGLVGCLYSENQIEIVLQVAERASLSRDGYEADSAVKEQRKHIAKTGAIWEAYASKGILENPRQPISVDDISTLGLNLDETSPFEPPESSSSEESNQERSITMRQAAYHIIHLINESIENAPEEASVQGKRLVKLNFDKGNLSPYYYLPANQNSGKRWAQQIVEALIAQGHVISLDTSRPGLYIIQA